MSTNLVAEFERELWRLYEEPKRLFGYNATYLLEMLGEGDPVQVASRLVLDPRHADGLTRLWEEKALDLSVEALVLKEQWRPLFGADVLVAARKKLLALGYVPEG